MKKLLYILLFVPLALFGQSFLSIQQDSPLELSSGWNMIGYSCYEPMNVTEAFSLIEDKVLIVKNNNGDAYIPEWSFNGIGDLIRNKGYQLKLTQAISDFQFCPFIVPLVYGCTDETAFNYNPNSNTDDGSCYPFVYGCLDNLYVEYNELANTDNGSCETLIVWGCIDESSLNFNEEATTDDGSCMYPVGGISITINNGWNMIGFTGCEITPIEEAFQDALGSGSLEETFEIIKDVRGIFWHQELGENSSLSHLTPGEGYMMYVKPGQATTVSFSEEYCNDITYQLNSGWNMVGFNAPEAVDLGRSSAGRVQALIDVMDPALGSGTTVSTFQLIKNVAGEFWHESVSLLGELIPGEAYMMYVNDGQQTALSFTDNSTQVFEYNPEVEFTLPSTDNNMSVVFPAGTLSNFAGAEITAQAVKYEYAGPADAILGIPPIDSTVTPTSETIIINEDGSAGIPVIGSDDLCGCSDIQAESGDVIRFVISTEEVPITVNTVPEVYYYGNTWFEIGEGESVHFSIDGDEVVFGCDDELSCNFNPEANMADGSCVYADEGYDCDGNIIEELIDIIYAEGGIVFYLDETGTRGLVAAWEDLPGTYEWGCFEEYVNGADGTSIGTGYQNTMDIANNGCMTENGGITAAQAALDYESEGYSDWYLPSKDELYEIYNTIGTPIGTGIGSVNIGGFVNDYYWSSSEYNNLDAAWIVNFADGGTGFPPKLDLIKVRPIRAFGNWTMGCMDSLACNYNPEANMSDGSCEFAELGYDCEGNITEYIVGMQAEGGIVFYVDETGEHGLVSALEDLTNGAIDPYGYGSNNYYEWGCYGASVSGAYGTSIGTGYQNTMTIVNQVCESDYGGITAAQAALDAEINGYSDWYLPSKDELVEMYNTIGDGGLEGNIGGFENNIWENSFYWSSSEDDSYNAWSVNFDDGITYYGDKFSPGRVRVIRAF